MTVNAAGKIQLTLQPALPATCAVCNKSANNSTKFIDFAKDLDYYGAVVICEDCVREALELLECVPVALVNEANEQLAVLHDRIQEVQAENVRLNNTLDNILSLRPGLSEFDSSVTESDDSSPEETSGGFPSTSAGLFE